MSDKLGTTIKFSADRGFTWRQLVWYALRNSWYNTTAELKIALVENKISKSDFDFYKEMLYKSNIHKNDNIDNIIGDIKSKTAVENQIAKTYRDTVSGDTKLISESSARLTTKSKSSLVKLPTNPINIKTGLLNFYEGQIVTDEMILEQAKKAARQHMASAGYKSPYQMSQSSAPFGYTQHAHYLQGEQERVAQSFIKKYKDYLTNIEAKAQRIAEIERGDTNKFTYKKKRKLKKFPIKEKQTVIGDKKIVTIKQVVDDFHTKNILGEEPILSTGESKGIAGMTGPEMTTSEINQRIKYLKSRIRGKLPPTRGWSLTEKLRIYELTYARQFKKKIPKWVKDKAKESKFTTVVTEEYSPISQKGKSVKPLMEKGRIPLIQKLKSFPGGALQTVKTVATVAWKNPITKTIIKVPIMEAQALNDVISVLAGGHRLPYIGSLSKSAQDIAKSLEDASKEKSGLEKLKKIKKIPMKVIKTRLSYGGIVSAKSYAMGGKVYSQEIRKPKLI
jgi:hypothetical protein